MAVPDILINEIDARGGESDDLEFVELYDGGTGNTDLSGLVLVFYDGDTDTSYYAMDLDGYATDENGLFVAGNASVNTVFLTFANQTLQNGADGVALYVGDAGDFPNGTAVTTVNLVDAMVYDTGQDDDAGTSGAAQQRAAPGG